MSEHGFNLTTDGVYAFDYPDDQDLLIVMQPAGPSGECYELGYVTPDQLRDSLQVVGLLPAPVEEERRPC